MHINSFTTILQCLISEHYIILENITVQKCLISEHSIKVKSSMARSLPVENLLPQNVGSISTTSSNY